jgi:pyruvate carboxylase subunit B
VKYIVDVNGERIEVEVDGDAVTIEGETLQARIADVEGTPIRLVTLGDELHRVATRRGDSRGRYALWMDGYRYDVKALDERMRTIRDLTAASSQASGPRPLTAPMPGLIVRVQVQVGDSVETGDALVVMEAMKMENELRASSGGIVSKIHVTVGTAVEKGALLVEL